MDDTLGMALTKVLNEYEPKLVSCDIEASARAAAEVSTLLGCILATILVKAPDQYEKSLERVIDNMHGSAMRVAQIATDTAADTKAFNDGDGTMEVEAPPPFTDKRCEGGDIATNGECLHCNAAMGETCRIKDTIR